MTDRASAEELREAARAMWYVHTEDQRFAGPVSADPYGDFERALLAALRDTGPRPDSGIDVERVRYALGQLYPWQSGPTNAKDASRFIREYARLSTPRTETSETADTVRIGSKTYLAGSDDD